MERGREAPDRRRELCGTAAGFLDGSAAPDLAVAAATWRRAWRAGLLGREVAPEFSPVIVAPDPAPMAPARPDAAVRSIGRMEIELGADRRIVVGADVDAAALARVLAVLERR